MERRGKTTETRDDPLDFTFTQAHTPHTIGFTANVTLVIQSWSHHISTHHFTFFEETRLPRKKKKTKRELTRTGVDWQLQI